MSLLAARRTFIGLALAAPLAFAGTSGFAATEGKAMERTVTVTASGRASATPDMARVTAGVTTEGDTARSALERNNETMGKVIEGLKRLGIDAKDLGTSSLHVEPRYTNARDGQAPRINGYRATNQVTLVQRQLGKVGEVLDQLVTLGANQIGGLSFEVSKAETLRDEARKEAIANARRRAELYAAAAGVEVDKVMTISEDTATMPHPRGVALGRAQMSAAVPVEAGSQELEATVTVTWSLK